MKQSLGATWREFVEGFSAATTWSSESKFCAESKDTVLIAKGHYMMLKQEDATFPQHSEGLKFQGQT